MDEPASHESNDGKRQDHLTCRSSSTAIAGSQQNEYERTMPRNKGARREISLRRIGKLYLIKGFKMRKDRWWELILLSVVGGAAAVQLVITIINNGNTTQQTQQLITAAGISARAARDNVIASRNFADSARGINQGVGDAVSKLNSQALGMQALAEEAVIQAQASRIQAVAAEKSEALLEAQLLPHVTVEHMDVVGPLIAGIRTKVANGFINSGGSVAYDVQTLARCDTVVDGSGPKFEFKSFTGSKADVASRGTFDTPLYIGPQTAEQLEQIKLGKRKVYMTGEIIYSDFAHRVHHTFYCMEMDPFSGSMNGCGAQKPPDD